MERLIKFIPFAHYLIHSAQGGFHVPRWSSVCLGVIFWGFFYSWHVTHESINLWLGTIVGFLGLDHYIGMSKFAKTFFKSERAKYKSRREIERIKKNKTGGKR